MHKEKKLLKLVKENDEIENVKKLWYNCYKVTIHVQKIFYIEAEKDLDNDRDIHYFESDCLTIEQATKEFTSLINYSKNE